MVADGERPTVLSVQKYESGPPVAESSNGQMVSSDGDTIAATKQEEWVKKKRVELTTTKQIETRVKRQIVLEDGKVVDDSGPIVTTNTTEDTDKQESEHTEHFTHGDDMDGKEGWVAVEEIPESAVVKETNERKITTHDEVEDIYETEEIQHLGDISNERVTKALRNGTDTRGLLSSSEKRELLPYYNKDPQKKVLQQSRRHDRTTDIEDTKEVSKMKDNGNVVTEITRRHEHEEFHNEDIPDSDSDEYEHIENREGNQDYSHGKSENFIEYVAVPKGGNYGVKIGDGARLVSENISSQRHGDDDLWDSVSERIRRNPSKPAEALTTTTTKFGPIPQRPDVLTNRPLDMGQEEHTKRHETDRWLNSHFGSFGSSSSSLNSELSPRSPIAATPTGIHVTMTSRSSQIHSPTPPAPPQPILNHNSSKLKQSSRSHSKSSKFHSKEPVGKKISFEDSPSRPSPTHQHSVHFDLKNRHEDVMRSVNSPVGRVTVTKSGSPWDAEPTPTPPPRSRRTRSPDHRADHFSHHDQIHHIKHSGIMNNSSRKYSPDYTSSYLQKTGDVGERKGYERREQNFGYNGPATTDSLETGNFGSSGYVSKQSNYYKTDETDNPGQNSMYENGEAEVEQRKTVERKERSFTYDGPAQKQFHPKYIVGTPASTIGRLKGIEHTGAVTENDRSQTLPRRRFYFGDDQGSLLGVEGKKPSSGGKAIRFGADDINVSISNNYQNTSDSRRGASLSRSMSFTPRSMGKEKPQLTSRLSHGHKTSPVYTSNPQLLDSPDLLAPKLLQSMSKSVRDINTMDRQRNDTYNYSTGMNHETTNVSKSKRTFLDNLKRNSTDLYDSNFRSSKATSPARSMTPTNAYSPLRSSDNSRALASRNSLNSPRGFGGASSPLSDDYNETYVMSSTTPDHDEGKPRISTDTTSRFSRRTLRGSDGQAAGTVESSATTTRTKSRFKESEIMYPNGRRVGSPASFQSDLQPRQLTSGTVIIPVRDTNNNKNGGYRN